MQSKSGASTKLLQQDSVHWPLVSVVMPAYNHEKYIESAIKSIWSMNYRPIELIVLNDGSTDNTLNVLRRMEKASPIGMVVIDKQNEGICKTLNRGVALARGKYITFLASDDEFVPERMTAHVKFLELAANSEVSGCYGQQRVIDEEGNIKVDVVKRRMVYPDLFVALLECELPFSLQGSTFRTDIVRELGFDESLFFEDWDFFIRLSLNHRFLYLPGVAFRYRGHEAGMNRNMERMANARMDVFKKHKSEPRVLDYGARKFKSYIELKNAQGYFLVGDFHSARKSLLQSWMSWPVQFFLSVPLAIKLMMGTRAVRLARSVKRAFYSKPFVKSAH